MTRNFIIPIVTLACLLAAGRMARGQETNDNSGLDYKSFQLISRHNMFDPRRRPDRPSRPYVAPRVTRVDSFTLVGTMSYEQGQYAFFDSNSSQYRKTLKPADTIAGYKIVQIASDYVKLAAASNRTINLPVGTKMKRQEGGPWMVAGIAEPDADAPPLVSAPSDTGGMPAMPGAPAAPASASESDALKRLMLKRLQEK
jgi:hypothetical protein